MRQLSGMEMRTQATAPTAATVSNMSASRPAASAAATGGVATSANFTQTFNQVQRDVAAYIAKGDGGFPAETPPRRARR